MSRVWFELSLYMTVWLSVTYSVCWHLAWLHSFPPELKAIWPTACVPCRAGSRKLWSADGGGAAREVSHLPPAEWESLDVRDTGNHLGIPVSFRGKDDYKRPLTTSVSREGGYLKDSSEFLHQSWLRNIPDFNVREEALILIQRKENIELGAGINIEIWTVCDLRKCKSPEDLRYK